MFPCTLHSYAGVARSHFKSCQVWQSKWLSAGSIPARFFHPGEKICNFPLVNAWWKGGKRSHFSEPKIATFQVSCQTPFFCLAEAMRRVSESESFRGRWQLGAQTGFCLGMQWRWGKRWAEYYRHLFWNTMTFWESCWIEDAWKWGTGMVQRQEQVL